MNPQKKVKVALEDRLQEGEEEGEDVHERLGQLVTTLNPVSLSNKISLENVLDEYRMNVFRYGISSEAKEKEVETLKLDPLLVELEKPRFLYDTGVVEEMARSGMKGVLVNLYKMLEYIKVEKDTTDLLKETIAKGERFLAELSLDLLPDVLRHDNVPYIEELEEMVVIEEDVDVSNHGNQRQGIIPNGKFLLNTTNVVKLPHPCSKQPSL
jgi:hypothetical protein